IGWIHGVARRRLGDPHLAEDVTQAVFVILHRKSPQLAADKALVSWLHKTAWYATETALRDRRRRAGRETEAARIQMNERDADENRWEELAPILDELIDKLKADDRDAILLRYYRDMSFADVGREIGTTEEAARKRVERAVNKLRSLAEQRGLTM